MKITIEWEESDIKKGVHVTSDDYHREYLLMSDNLPQITGEKDATKWYLVNVAKHEVIELGTKRTATLTLSQDGYMLHGKD